MKKKKAIVISKNHGWEFVSKHTIDEVVEMASVETFKSLRVRRLLKLIEKSGTKCVKCGLEGTHFESHRDFGGDLHLDLYSDDTHCMTIDHIIPISKGGKKKDLNNMQIMCKVCNETKGNNLDF